MTDKDEQLAHKQAKSSNDVGVEEDRLTESTDESKDSIGQVPPALPLHPSRKLELRADGYGIAAGYEKPYRRTNKKTAEPRHEVYGPVPHSGYYGAGEGQTRFRMGEAGFKQELEWYRQQYGSETSGIKKQEK